MIVVEFKVGTLAVATRLAAGAELAAAFILAAAHAVAARFTRAAGIVTGAAVTGIRLHVLDAVAIAATARSVANRDPVRIVAADARTAVAAFAAVIRVVMELANTGAVTAGFEWGAADVAADLVADRAGKTRALEADLVIGAGGAAACAIVSVGREIDALAIAFVAAALALALAALALGAVATILVPVAVSANLLASGSGLLCATTGQQRAEAGAEERLDRAPPRRGECSRQGIEAWTVHDYSVLSIFAGCSVSRF
jgi:hypothetical protein